MKTFLIRDVTNKESATHTRLDGSFVRVLQIPFTTAQFLTSYNAASMSAAEAHWGLAPIVITPMVTTPVALAKTNLANAEKNGIEIPFGDSSVRLACDPSARALFASALTLYREAEELQPTEEAKAAFRASNVTFSDIEGTPHTITVVQARQLLVAYGAAYQALWAAAATQ